MKVGVLTSVDTRHRYFARTMCRKLPVAAVAYEYIAYSPVAVCSDRPTPQETAIVEHHFAERSRQEEVFFGDCCEPIDDSASCRVRHLGPGKLNSDETVAFLADAGVDTVAVYGTNLVKPPLLNQCPGRMVNMHLGLSPYYRGTATNFYPLLNEEPEYVGATIHLLDAGIDSGPILRHVRPEIVADDMPHTIGCKAIHAGIDAMIAVLTDLERGSIDPVAQWEVDGARLYLRKDYHPRQVVELYRKIDAGLIRRYVERHAASVQNLKLIE